MIKFLSFFYKERHHFLIKKWWFRLLTVLYTLALLLVAVFSCVGYREFFKYQCENSKPEVVNQLSEDNIKTLLNAGASTEQIESIIYTGKASSDYYENRTKQCSKLNFSQELFSIVLGLLSTIIFNFIVQILFFKVLIDYVIFGKSVSNK